MSVLTRREFVTTAAAAIPAAAAAPSLLAQDPTAKRPNVVYLFADQMRNHAMNCMGNDQVISPNLDKLAAEGFLLENAIACSPVCTPYRGQLLTGRYGHSTGVITNDVRLPDDEFLISQAMKQAGYTTGYIGKWHLAGYRKDPVDAVSRRGWDFWAVRNCSHKHSKPQYWLNDSKEVVTVKGWEPDIQTDLAIEFIKKQKAAPFALMVSYGPPHNPYKAPDRFVKQYAGRELKPRPNVPKHNDSVLRHYYAMVTSLDECVGRISAALEEAGIADDTIFCFTSDHGDMLGSQGHKLKQRPWEESINVPFMVRYPRRIKPEQRSDALLASVDIMPTFLGMCGVPVPDRVEGINQTDMLFGKKKDMRDEVFLFNVHAGGGPLTDWRGIRTKDWVYAYHYAGDWILYDLNNDPHQLKNLIDDPAYAAKKAELRKRLDSIRRELGESRPLQGEDPAPIQLPA
jgi:arylsulfatase A-like enzyme